MKRVAIQKGGRLTAGSIDMLHSWGYDFELDGRALYSVCNNAPLEIFYVRHEDIPRLVRAGAIDYGIVHEVALLECGWKFSKHPLGFGQCSLVLAGERGANVATAYPNIARSYLGRHARIVAMGGSVELAPRLGLAPAIVEIVRTGETLRAHGLQIVEHIYRNLDTCLIARHAAIAALVAQEPTP